MEQQTLAQQYMSKAYALLEQKRIEETLVVYQEFLELRPGFAKDYMEHILGLAQIVFDSQDVQLMGRYLDLCPSAIAALIPFIDERTSQFVKDYLEHVLNLVRDSQDNQRLSCFLEHYSGIVESLVPFVEHRLNTLPKDYIEHVLDLGRVIYESQDNQLLNRFLTFYPSIISLLSPYAEYQSNAANVYHCSVPKAATQWVRMILSDSRVFAKFGLVPIQVEFLKSLDNIPVRTTVTGTFTIKYEEFLAIPKPDRYKAFFVMRDPRDIVISAYFSNRYSHILMDHIDQTRIILESLPFEDGILYTIDSLLEVFEILRSWSDAPTENPSIRLYKYEDLTGSSQASFVSQLLLHCDCPINDELTQQILDDYHFEKLTAGRKQGQSDHKSHYRKGKPGDWKIYFTQKIRERFEEVAPGLIECLGYSWEGLDGKQAEQQIATMEALLLEEKQALSPEEKVKKSLADMEKGKGIEIGLRMGRKYYDMNNLGEATSYYCGAIDIAKDLITLNDQSASLSEETLKAYLSEAYLYMGLIATQQERTQEAIRYHQSSMSFQNVHNDASFYLASLYSKQGQIQDAIDCYQQYLAWKPDAADTHFYLGTLYLQQEKLDQAMIFFEKSLSLNASLTDALFYLGQIHFRKNHLDGAMRYFERCVQVNPNFGDPYFYMGEILMKKGEFEKSLCYHDEFQKRRT